MEGQRQTDPGVPLEVLQNYVPAKGSGRHKGREGSDGRQETTGHRDSRRESTEYMDWMKNLAMFHQMREKAEETRSKEKLDDYKMQIVRSLMQKNKMLEEIEQKLTKMEDGDDPIQQKLLDKIAALENTVASRSTLKKEMGNSEGKINQMMDFMMYNMTTLQQMVQNVAQMQRMQYQHAQETNRIIQSLPQILTNARYQSGDDINDKNIDKTRRKKASQPQDDGSHNQGFHRPKEKGNKSIAMSKLSSIKGSGKSKSKQKDNMNYMPKDRIGSSKMMADQQASNKLSRDKRRGSIDSDEILAFENDPNKVRQRDLNTKKLNLQNSKGLSINALGQGNSTEQKKLNKLDRQKSEFTNLSKPLQRTQMGDGTSMKRQETPIKINGDNDDYSSNQSRTIKTDSLNMDKFVEKSNKTMLKDDSMAMSEGNLQANSQLNMTRIERTQTRRKTENAENKNDITVLQMLAQEKSHNNPPKTEGQGDNRALKGPILEGLNDGQKAPDQPGENIFKSNS